MTTPAIWPALRPLPPLGIGTGVLDDTVEYRSLFTELVHYHEQCPWCLGARMVGPYPWSWWPALTDCFQSELE